MRTGVSFRAVAGFSVVEYVLRHLRDEGICTIQKGRVVFSDRDGLANLARFDRAYFDHEGPPLA